MSIAIRQDVPKKSNICLVCELKEARGSNQCCVRVSCVCLVLFGATITVSRHFTVTGNHVASLRGGSPAPSGNSRALSHDPHQLFSPQRARSIT